MKKICHDFGKSISRFLEENILIQVSDLRNDLGLGFAKFLDGILGIFGVFGVLRGFWYPGILDLLRGFGGCWYSGHDHGCSCEILSWKSRFWEKVTKINYERK